MKTPSLEELEKTEYRNGGYLNPMHAQNSPREFWRMDHRYFGARHPIKFNEENPVAALLEPIGLTDDQYKEHIEIIGQKEADKRDKENKKDYEKLRQEIIARGTTGKLPDGGDDQEGNPEIFHHFLDPNSGPLEHDVCSAIWKLRLYREVIQNRIKNESNKKANSQ